MRKQLREVRRLRLRTDRIAIAAAKRNFTVTVGDLEMALMITAGYLKQGRSAITAGT